MTRWAVVAARGSGPGPGPRWRPGGLSGPPPPSRTRSRGMAARGSGAAGVGGWRARHAPSTLGRSRRHPWTATPVSVEPGSIETSLDPCQTCTRGIRGGGVWTRPGVGPSHELRPRQVRTPGMSGGALDTDPVRAGPGTARGVPSIPPAHAWRERPWIVAARVASGPSTSRPPAPWALDAPPRQTSGRAPPSEGAQGAEGPTQERPWRVFPGARELHGPRAPL